VVEDLSLESLEIGTRLEPELVGETTAPRLVGRESLGLSPGAIQREHEQAERTLTERMLTDDELDLGYELGIPPEGEIRLDPLLVRHRPALFQPKSVLMRKLFVEHVRQRGATPEGDRGSQCPARFCGIAPCELLPPELEQLLEPVEIALARLDVEHVTRWASRDATFPEQLSES
jgi:hypothetical protein